MVDWSKFMEPSGEEAAGDITTSGESKYDFADKPKASYVPTDIIHCVDKVAKRETPGYLKGRNRKTFRKRYKANGGTFVVRKRKVAPEEVPKFGGRLSKYPFDRMRVNDMFSVYLDTTYEPITEKRLQRLAASVRGAARKYSKPLGKQFTTRTFLNCVRVWRVK